MTAETGSPPSTSSQATAEIARGERFAFGRNWQQFLNLLDDERIAEAESSLRAMLQITDLRGRSFLDIGCGSGLFSLAARRLDARVHSFDYDEQSVVCAQELRRRYRPDDGDWTIQAGSVLDAKFMGRLGTFDVVYAWGVLHHTGHMWAAVEQALRPVRPGGRLWLALYNHQPLLTPWWKLVKGAYRHVPAALRPMYALPFFCYVGIAGLAGDLARGVDPRRRYRGRGRRGMSLWYDVLDWVGGWPFEVAAPEEVLAFARARGFTLVGLKTVAGRNGCNEFLLQRDTLAP